MSWIPSAAGTAMPFHLQAIDVLLLVILALAALSGWRRGFAMVLLGYLGLLVGLALGVWAIGSVVYFDPAHDLALLSVPDLTVKPLRLAGAAATRGQNAVVIGYPGGGGQQFIGAEIVLRTRPEAPDIYSRPQSS